MNRFDELSRVSAKSIDINSVVNNGDSLMDDLRLSYPLEDMRLSLSNLPENMDLDNLVNCSRSYSSSEASQVCSRNSLDCSVDVAIIDH